MFSWLRLTPPPTERQLRLTRALADYPPYVPPAWTPDSSSESLRAASARYREHFFDSMQFRLEALRAFLAKFDVALDVDDAGLTAVSAWLPQWGDLLVDDFPAAHDAYRFFSEEWTGGLKGLNVIFDLGIYQAECLWARRTKLEWIVVRGRDVHGIVMATHSIKGLPGGKLFGPIDAAYFQCWSIRNARINMQKGLPYSSDPEILMSDSFSRTVLAKAPPGRRTRKSAPRQDRE